MSLIERFCGDTEQHGPHWHQSGTSKAFCDGWSKTRAYRVDIGDERSFTEEEEADIRRRAQREADERDLDREQNPCHQSAAELAWSEDRYA